MILLIICLFCSGNIIEKKIILEKLKVNEETTLAVEELLNIYTFFSQ